MEASSRMQLFDVYRRALMLLRDEWRVGLALALANTAIGLAQLIEPVLFGKVIDALTRSQPTGSLIGAWAVLGGFSILAGVVVAVAADRLAHRQRLAAMSKAFERAITLPISYHAERGTGAVVRTIMAGAASLFGTWLTVLREQISALTSIAFLVPVAFWIEWRLALLLLGLALIYAILNVLVIRLTSDRQAAVEDYHVAVAGRVGDVVGNVSVVQSYARLVTEADQMRGAMRQLLDAQYPVLTWWGVLNVLSRSAGTVTMIMIFTTGSYLAARGEITVGEIVSFVGFAGLAITKLDQLSGFISRLFMEAPTLGTYFALLDQDLELEESPDAPPLSLTRASVTFDGVSFRFGDSLQGVFDIDICAKPGETVALVGPTGAGKTTLMALLQRLRDPDAGRILVDDQDIRHVQLTSLRAAMAVVFQDAGLFNRSIMENIRIGRPAATDADVMAAAELAQARQFILEKPGGMAFTAGERGASLSGGERQRIAIARAILKDAPILVLDEATSALDTRTEAQIKRALDDLRKGRTTFIIAHRLSTVADADKIIVLDRGRVIEQGRFGELIDKGGLFARLVDDGNFTKPKTNEPPLGD